ncbi:hypothetical protein JYU34_004393 [Plutella xylostella]|uniref:FLYWCH-type domain-containing protein n=1 Tax=Plutella xylostella TaxID=51655 RepID=A0ABQ7QXW5_PLUXY|nr:hypothetical protein JYU34_004393 [Plutella xylostella]
MIIEKPNGKRYLKIGDYRFSYHKTLRDGRVRWKCSSSRQSCKVYVITDGDDIVSMVHEHTHSPAVHRTKKNVKQATKNNKKIFSE